MGNTTASPSKHLTFMHVCSTNIIFNACSSQPTCTIRNAVGVNKMWAGYVKISLLIKHVKITPDYNQLPTASFPVAIHIKYSINVIKGW